MKELELINDHQVIEQKKPIIKEHKLIGRLFPHRGHTCFEINVKTKEVSLAKFENVNASFNGGRVNKKIVMNPDCVYITALNKKNALKHLNKMK